MEETKHTVTCRTEGCENFGVPFEKPPWVLVLCGGGCNNFIQQEDPNHPDFPKPEIVETQEEMIARIVAETLVNLGVVS